MRGGGCERWLMAAARPSLVMRSWRAAVSSLALVVEAELLADLQVLGRHGVVVVVIVTPPDGCTCPRLRRHAIRPAMRSGDRRALTIDLSSDVIWHGFLLLHVATPVDDPFVATERLVDVVLADDFRCREGKGGERPSRGAYRTIAGGHTSNLVLPSPVFTPLLVHGPSRPDTHPPAPRKHIAGGALTPSSQRHN